MTKTGWIVVGVIVVVAAALLLWWSSASAPAVDQGASSTVPMGTETPVSPESSAGPTSATPAPSVPMSATVTYDGTSFSPASVTIAKGGAVTFSGTGEMWVASAMHPAHSGYDGTDRATHCASTYTGAKPFDQCAKGSSYSFTFDKTGSFPYHDHLNASAFGKVVVQ